MLKLESKRFKFLVDLSVFEKKKTNYNWIHRVPITHLHEIELN